MSWDYSCSKCNRKIGDINSVRNRMGELLCYDCAYDERYKWYDYHDDDEGEFGDNRE